MRRPGNRPTPMATSDLAQLRIYPPMVNATAVRSRVLVQVARTEAAELRFVAATIALVLALTSLPYLYAYSSTPADKDFTGIMLDAPDYGQYFSWMRELSAAPLASN